MKKIGKRVFLSDDDNCPICGTPVKDMVFTWNMAHGEATSSCCGAVYQIKDYYIEKPTKQEKECLKLLREGYIEFLIREDWVEPLKKAINSIGIKNIHNDIIINIARSIKNS